jgi:coproporphyrinogen III oxidase-like Fe-S oxidoreductase
VLEPAEQDAEALTLAVRTRAGIKVAGVVADDPRVVACTGELVDIGLLVRDDDRLVLTRAGRLLANEVTARVLGALEQPAPADGTR